VSLGVRFRGELPRSGLLKRTPAAATVLEQVLSSVENRRGELLDDAWREDATLALSLHPAAEPAYVAVDGGYVVVGAQTSSAGPGYHAFVYELADELATDLGVTWHPSDDEFFDETGYREHRDVGDLQDEMLAWLGAVSAAVAEEVDGGAANIAVAMPLGHGFAELDAVTTPLGPRSRAWVEAVAADAAHGLDFFAWWEPGFGPRYLRGRALTNLWCRIPWRAPLAEDEAALMRGTLALLADAHAADPELALPWAAWAELAAHAGAADTLPPDVLEAAEADPSPPVGYRRHDVTPLLPGGWTIRVPGSFAASLDPDGTWSAGEGGDRSVNVTTFTGPPDQLDESDLAASSGEEHRHDDESVRRRAWTTTEEGLLLVNGYGFVPGSAAIVTVTAEPGGESWALDVWRSLTPPRN
jgi:hypothetical protein